MGKKILKIVYYILIAILIICIAILGYTLINDSFINNKLKEFHTSSVNQNNNELAENPIDFESLKQTNSEIYAWIRIPNTNIDYPIAQSATDDKYYLHHDIYGKWIFAGTIYTEMQNSKDFSDPVTLVYGHNMTKGYMFHNLYKFQDKDFFDNNKYFYIYTPGHILKYTIFSAHQYDNRHILNSFDFSKKEVLEGYIYDSMNPTFMLKNVRNDINVTTDDKIVTLSTCLGSGKTYRYLVQGVLTDDIPTK